MYLDTSVKSECTGCEACFSVCTKDAISMSEDLEGFRYPVIDNSKCIHCNLCRKICPYNNLPVSYDGNKYAFGGNHISNEVLASSTSGGAFSAIAEACNADIIFGAESKGTDVFHSYITDVNNISKFRESKYSQSKIGSAYTDAKSFLKEGKTVLFSGTPCQIAGLKKIVGECDNLITVEVICEGVPSPLYIRKLGNFISEKYGDKISNLNYRYKNLKTYNHNTYGKWDFQVMKILLENGREIKKDRWFNPFWSIWLNHLMSRPSCYHCQFASTARIADITLGDLWGVHLYCPELYNNNAGASLVVCNSEKGKNIFKQAQVKMNGHELKFEDALRYQSPLKKTISENPDRAEFMLDLQGNLSIDKINKKWAKPPMPKLLWQKYIWGNRQKVFFSNHKHKSKKEE